MRIDKLDLNRLPGQALTATWTRVPPMRITPQLLQRIEQRLEQGLEQRAANLNKGERNGLRRRM